MKKILIVDDTRSDREILKAHLKENNERYKFLDCETIAEALSLYNKHSPDCIILDYYLGADKGVSLIHEIIKEHGKASPVVIISGNPTEEIAIEAREIGAVCIFDKNSLSPRILRGTVECMLDM